MFCFSFLSPSSLEPILVTLTFVYFNRSQEAKKLVAANSCRKLTDEEIIKLDDKASDNWDKFYGIHQVFYQDSALDPSNKSVP
jgi:hypothetical protein